MTIRWDNDIAVLEDDVQTLAVPSTHTEHHYCSVACARCEVKMTRRSRQLKAAVVADGFGRRGSSSWQQAYMNALWPVS